MNKPNFYQYLLFFFVYVLCSLRYFVGTNDGLAYILGTLRYIGRQCDGNGEKTLYDIT